MGVTRFTKILLTFIVVFFANFVFALDEFRKEVEEKLEQLNFTDSDYKKIISYVSGNEFSNDPNRVIEWNDGEAFVSLGIGHFIWYPSGVEKKFTESFPKMARFIYPLWPNDQEIPQNDKAAFDYAKTFFFNIEGGVKFCPWPTKAKFLEWKKVNPTYWQFLVKFLNHPLIKILQISYMDSDFREALVFLYQQLNEEDDLIAMEAPSDVDMEVVRMKHREIILSLLSSREGAVALMDYVNFKGDGTDKIMRYSGVGWGLQQVLYWTDLYANSEEQLESFARAALNRLTRRTTLSGRAIEKEWLHGWANRVLGYGFNDEDTFIQHLKQERGRDGALKWPKLKIGNRALKKLFKYQD